MHMIFQSSRQLTTYSSRSFIDLVFLVLLTNVLICLLLNTVSLAQPVQDSNKSESVKLTKQEIEELKLQVEKTYKSELEACYQKFAVNNCKSDALQKKYKELSRIRLLDLDLKSKERAQKAEELDKESQIKALEREQTQQEKKVQANIDYQNRLKENQDKNDQFNAKSRPSTPSGKGEGREPMTTPEGEARAQFEAKQREAMLHKQEVLEKLKDKEKSKLQSKPSAPVTPSSN